MNEDYEDGKENYEKSVSETRLTRSRVLQPHHLQQEGQHYFAQQTAYASGGKPWMNTNVTTNISISKPQTQFGKYAYAMLDSDNWRIRGGSDECDMFDEVDEGDAQDEYGESQELAEYSLEGDEGTQGAALAASDVDARYLAATLMDMHLDNMAAALQDPGGAKVTVKSRKNASQNDEDLEKSVGEMQKDISGLLDEIEELMNKPLEEFADYEDSVEYNSMEEPEGNMWEKFDDDNGDICENFDDGYNDEYSIEEDDMDYLQLPDNANVDQDLVNAGGLGRSCPSVNEEVMQNIHESQRKILDAEKYVKQIEELNKLGYQRKAKYEKDVEEARASICDPQQLQQVLYDLKVEYNRQLTDISNQRFLLEVPEAFREHDDILHEHKIRHGKSDIPDANVPVKLRSLPSEFSPKQQRPRRPSDESQSIICASPAIVKRPSIIPDIDFPASRKSRAPAFGTVSENEVCDYSTEATGTVAVGQMPVAARQSRLAPPGTIAARQSGIAPPGSVAARQIPVPARQSGIAPPGTIAARQSGIAPPGSVAARQIPVPARQSGIVPPGMIAARQSGIAPPGSVAARQIPVPARQSGIAPPGTIAARQSGIAPPGSVAAGQIPVPVRQSGIAPPGTIAARQSGIAPPGSVAARQIPVPRQSGIVPPGTIAARQSGIAPPGSVAAGQIPVPVRQSGIAPPGTIAARQIPVPARQSGIAPPGTIAARQMPVAPTAPGICPLEAPAAAAPEPVQLAPPPPPEIIVNEAPNPIDPDRINFEKPFNYIIQDVIRRLRFHDEDDLKMVEIIKRDLKANLVSAYTSAVLQAEQYTEQLGRKTRDRRKTYLVADRNLRLAPELMDPFLIPARISEEPEVDFDVIVPPEPIEEEDQTPKIPQRKPGRLAGDKSQIQCKAKALPTSKLPLKDPRLKNIKHSHQAHSEKTAIKKPTPQEMAEIKKKYTIKFGSEPRPRREIITKTAVGRAVAEAMSALKPKQLAVKKPTPQEMTLIKKKYSIKHGSEPKTRREIITKSAVGRAVSEAMSALKPKQLAVKKPTPQEMTLIKKKYSIKHGSEPKTRREIITKSAVGRAVSEAMSALKPKQLAQPSKIPGRISSKSAKSAIPVSRIGKGPPASKKVSVPAVKAQARAAYDAEVAKTKRQIKNKKKLQEQLNYLKEEYKSKLEMIEKLGRVKESVALKLLNDLKVLQATVDDPEERKDLIDFLKLELEAQSEDTGTKVECPLPPSIKKTAAPVPDVDDLEVKPESAEEGQTVEDLQEIYRERYLQYVEQLHKIYSDPDQLQMELDIARENYEDQMAKLAKRKEIWNELASEETDQEGRMPQLEAEYYKEELKKLDNLEQKYMATYLANIDELDSRISDRQELDEEIEKLQEPHQVRMMALTGHRQELMDKLKQVETEEDATKWNRSPKGVVDVKKSMENKLTYPKNFGRSNIRTLEVVEELPEIADISTEDEKLISLAIDDPIDDDLNCIMQRAKHIFLQKSRAIPTSTHDDSLTKHRVEDFAKSALEKEETDEVFKAMMLEKRGVSFAEDPSKVVSLIVPSDTLKLNVVGNAIESPSEGIITSKIPTPEINMLDPVATDEVALTLKALPHGEPDGNIASKQLGEQKVELSLPADKEQVAFLECEVLLDEFCAENYFQSKGSTLPKWYPGFFTAYPDEIPVVLLQRSPSVVLLTAWQKLQPDYIKS